MFTVPAAGARRVPGRRRAFTLIELIIVLVVLAVLAGLAIPTYQRVVIGAHDHTTAASLAALDREAHALAAQRAGSNAAAVSMTPTTQDYTDALADCPACSAAGRAGAPGVLAAGAPWVLTGTGHDGSSPATAAGQLSMAVDATGGVSALATVASTGHTIYEYTIGTTQSHQCIGGPVAGTAGADASTALGHCPGGTSQIAASGSTASSSSTTGLAAPTTAPATSPSPSPTVTVPATPGAPGSVQALPASTTTIAVAWTAPATGPAPDTYTVYRAKSGVTGWTQLGTVTAPATSYTDTPTDTATYCYQVTATAAGVTGPAGAQACSSTNEPAGILYNLGSSNGTASFANPATAGKVTVTATSTYGSQSASYATDRSSATAWGSASSGPQALTVDFGATHSVTLTGAWMLWGNAESGSLIEGSNDGTTWTTLWTQSANPPINTYVVTTATISSAGAWRYVRFNRPFTSTGWLGIEDVELFGTYH